VNPVQISAENDARRRVSKSMDAESFQNQQIQKRLAEIVPSQQLQRNYNNRVRRNFKVTKGH